MHELSVVESILDISLKHAERNGAKQIVKINLVLGELTGIVDQCITFYWEMLAKDTIASDAEIVFRKVPVVARCTSCGKQFTPEELDLTCPSCGENKAELVSGREFQVESIEIE
jgi:hydrogenase nickel incorporation protein HypA/HybF